MKVARVVRPSLLGHGRQSETRDEGTEETDEQPLQMTATAANARLLGCDEGPSNAWRTALALRADAQQSRPSAKSYPFAACRLGLEWAVLSSLAWVRLMRRCKSGGDPLPRVAHWPTWPTTACE